MSLEIRNLTIHHHNQKLLFEPLSFEISSGAAVALMGPSGIGKSTLLAAIAGFLPNEFTVSGDVELNGHDVMIKPAHKRKIGLMFQDALLFPHLSVGQNLAIAIPPSIKDRKSVVISALAQAGLSGFEDRDPATLSGGQQSRVALMRCLLAKPHALLLDEPFSKLDADLRADLRQFVFQTALEQNLPILMVTHDPNDAAALNGNIIQLRTSR